MTTSVGSRSLFTAPDTCSSQLNEQATDSKMIQDVNYSVGITTSRDDSEALFSSSLEVPPSSPLGNSVPSTSKHQYDIAEVLNGTNVHIQLLGNGQNVKNISLKINRA